MKETETAVSSACWTLNSWIMSPTMSNIPTMKMRILLVVGIVSRRPIYVHVAWKGDISSTHYIPYPISNNSFLKIFWELLSMPPRAKSLGKVGFITGEIYQENSRHWEWIFSINNQEQALHLTSTANRARGSERESLPTVLHLDSFSKSIRKKQGRSSPVCAIKIDPLLLPSCQESMRHEKWTSLSYVRRETQT